MVMAKGSLRAEPKGQSSACCLGCGVRTFAVTRDEELVCVCWEPDCREDCCGTIGSGSDIDPTPERVLMVGVCWAGPVASGDIAAERKGLTKM